MKNNLTINCDMGEGCPTDSEVMPFINCANVSCGAHAGDELTIRNTLQLARLHKVMVGAHPGYDDKENFGRLSLGLSDDDLLKSLVNQLTFFKRICASENMTIHYIKPHGAMNHDMLSNQSVLRVICQSMRETELVLPIMIPTCKHFEELLSITNEYDMPVIWEVFADRAYENNGLLRSRKLEGAVHDTAEKIKKQFQNININRKIISYYGQTINVASAESICIHGDHPPSIEAAKSFNLNKV